MSEERETAPQEDKHPPGIALLLAGVGAGVVATLAALGAAKIPRKAAAARDYEAASMPQTSPTASSRSGSRPSEPQSDATGESEAADKQAKGKTKADDEEESANPLPKITMGIGVLLALSVLANLIIYGLHPLPVEPDFRTPGGSPERGRIALTKYGCGSCHTIGGLPNATGRVGPKLLDIKKQTYIAGNLANAPHNMVFWLQNPQTYEPGTAMPDLGVTEAEARDMAAYLYTNQ